MLEMSIEQGVVTKKGSRFSRIPGEMVFGGVGTDVADFGSSIKC